MLRRGHSLHGTISAMGPADLPDTDLTPADFLHLQQTPGGQVIHLGKIYADRWLTTLHTYTLSGPINYNGAPRPAPVLAAADARVIRISRGAMPDAIVLLQMGVMNHNAASWPAPVLAAAGARVVRISRGAVF